MEAAMGFVSLNMNEELSQNVNYGQGGFPVAALEDGADHCTLLSSPVHWHYELELTTMERGSVVYTVNGRPYPLYEGQTIFVRPNTLHGAVGSANCQTRVLLISPRVFGDREVYLQPFIQRLIRQAPDAVILDGSQDWQLEMETLCAEIFRLCREKPDEFEIDAKMALFKLLKLMLSRLCTYGASRRKHAKNMSHAQPAKKMILFIQEHYGEKIGVADIARAGGVARNTCNNIFQDVFGKSPIEYLTEYRICAAMELLRKKAAVTDVAMSCGFNTASYFSKIFKETIGVAPLEFQKQGI